MKKLVLLLCVCSCHLLMSAVGLTVTNLRVDGQLCPLGVGHEQPIFTWTVEDGGLKGVKQQSYRVEADRNGYEVVKEFSEKISGAKKVDERVALSGLLHYVSHHCVDKVLGIACDIHR